MKQSKKTAQQLLVSLFIIMTQSGCRWVNSYDYSPYYHIFVEEEARLTEDAESPFLDFSIDYTCLNEENDSTAQLINRAIQRKFLGDNYADLAPQAAVDSFKNVYLRNYRKETGELYKESLDRFSSHEPMPEWCGQTYSMVTFIEEGRAGKVINASANTFVDMGGAHPNQWAQWLNFDAGTGKLLAKEDVFKAESMKDIEAMLLDKLILQQANLYPDDTLNTPEDLQQKGFLQHTPMYIPDNFQLRKKGVAFLFNRYDIAPYSAGEIVLELSYEEIEHCLKNN